MHAGIVTQPPLVLAYWVYTFTGSFNFNSLKSQQTIGHAKSIDMTTSKNVFSKLEIKIFSRDTLFSAL
jgi:hypothetical protein